MKGVEEASMEENVLESKSGWLNYINLSIRWIAIAMAIFQIYSALSGMIIPNMQRSIHLVFALVLVSLMYPLKLKNEKIGNVLNTAYSLVTLVAGLYIAYSTRPDYIQTLLVVGPSNVDIFIGAVLLVILLEAARRSSGLALPILGVLFILYAIIGQDLPGFFGHKGYTLTTIVDQLLFTSEGVFGEPLGVSATFVAMFILFGAFLEATGAGKWFIDIAFALTGTIRSGPAMTAVVSSAAMGTISGTGVANVVTTGAFTIPLMKSCGYHPAFAGAIEAAASTGGQIMPPIMGAGAFIMAEMMGMSYGQVALAALIPSILYFLAVGCQVHFEACKIGLKGLPKEQLPPLGPTFRNGIVYLIPLAVLVWALVIAMFSPSYAAIYGIVTMIVVSFFLMKKNKRIRLKDVLRALEEGAKNMVPVAMACATAGILIGVLLRTGLTLKFTSLVIAFSGDSIFLALLLTMLTCVVLGMGLPTTAAFIVTAALGGPALVKLGLAPMAAYMFIFYFACMSAITPPVALAAFAAAGVAKASPMKTGLIATRLGIAGFLIPFFFCYNNELLLMGETSRIIEAFITAVIGIVMLAAGLEGYMVAPISWYERIVVCIAALMLVDPNTMTDIAGIILGAIAFFPMFLRYRKVKSLVKV